MAFNLNELFNELKSIKFNQFHPSNLIQSTVGLYGLVDKFSGKHFSASISLLSSKFVESSAK